MLEFEFSDKLKDREFTAINATKIIMSNRFCIGNSRSKQEGFDKYRPVHTIEIN